MNKTVDISTKVLPSFYKPWNSSARYQMMTGGRGSGKSVFLSTRLIYHMMKYPLSNAVVIRKHYSLHRNSTFASIQSAIDSLGVSHLWVSTLSPLSFTYKPTGQQILFKGLDKEGSIKSITVPHGVLDIAWVEESTNITDESTFNTMDLSLRGVMPDGYKIQIWLSTNPASQYHWIYKRFIENPDPFTDVFTSTYLDNPYLSDADRNLFEYLKENNPTRYAVEGLGEWRSQEGLIFNNWQVTEFNPNDLIGYRFNEKSDFEHLVGIDFGFSNDPTAIVSVYVDKYARELYIADETYELHLTNPDVLERIIRMGERSSRIIADSAEPKSIQELRNLGLSVKGVKKGNDSIEYGIKLLQEYKIFIQPSCKNTVGEFSSYAYDEKTGKPMDMMNHAIDAIRYVAMTVEKSGISF